MVMGGRENMVKKDVAAASSRGLFFRKWAIPLTVVDQKKVIELIMGLCEFREQIPVYKVIWKKQCQRHY